MKDKRYKPDYSQRDRRKSLSKKDNQKSHELKAQHCHNKPLA